MKKNGRQVLILGILLIITFAVWTWMIQNVDVQPVGVNGTEIGFATWNLWFHNLTGVHMTIYMITDWLGLVPIAVCILFAIVGLIQMIKRRSLLKVDHDIIFLGIYYMIVIFGYLIFEMIPINYRPMLINGFMEASYPSSTTMLVLCVMTTGMLQLRNRIRASAGKTAVSLLITVYMTAMVIGRLISGVHWLTDIVGGILLSFSLIMLYCAISAE